MKGRRLGSGVDSTLHPNPWILNLHPFHPTEDSFFPSCFFRLILCILNLSAVRKKSVNFREEFFLDDLPNIRLKLLTKLLIAIDF
jgi:hypothetical protein